MEVVKRIKAKARAAGSAFAEVANEFSDHMKDLLYFDTAGKKGGYDNVDLWVNKDVRSSTVFRDLAILEQSFGEAGETFNPALHNAVMHVEDENLGEGEIVEVLQQGYMYGDKVLRYAMVKTAN